MGMSPSARSVGSGSGRWDVGWGGTAGGSGGVGDCPDFCEAKMGLSLWLGSASRFGEGAGGGAFEGDSPS